MDVYIIRDKLKKSLRGIFLIPMFGWSGMKKNSREEDGQNILKNTTFHESFRLFFSPLLTYFFVPNIPYDIEVLCGLFHDAPLLNA